MACHINYDLNILSDFATVNHTAYVLLWAPNCLLIPSFMEFRSRIAKGMSQYYKHPQKG